MCRRTRPRTLRLRLLSSPPALHPLCWVSITSLQYVLSSISLCACWYSASLASAAAVRSDSTAVDFEAVASSVYDIPGTVQVVKLFVILDTICFSLAKHLIIFAVSSVPLSSLGPFQVLCIVPSVTFFFLFFSLCSWFSRCNSSNSS